MGWCFLESKKTLKITGMTCTNCAKLVEKSLSKVDGVKFAAVNLATGTAFVVLEKPVSEDALIKAVQSVGYGVSTEFFEEIEERHLERIKINMLISLLTTVPLMIFMFLNMNVLHFNHFTFFELIFSGLVIFYAGRDTIRGALIALLHKHANMDTLIFFGSITAWLTNIITYFGVEIHPFGTIGSMIISLHLVGRFLESKLREKASKQVRQLFSLQSKEALVITEKGEFLMPIDAIKEGFVILVKPGERIPTDGVILDGYTTLDESMVTGESLPVSKGPGDEVIGGSLNLTGFLKIKVTRTGKDTFLSKMINLVQEAQGAKIPIQALADRITNWFVPAVILLAFLSALLWYFRFDDLMTLTHRIREFLPWTMHTTDRLSFAVFVFLTTIVIACPCALGLATPMALVIGTSIAARKGLLIRNAEVIQTAGEVGYVLFDKTGTITRGKPYVVYCEIPENEKNVIKSIANLSNHPLSKAIVEYLDTKTGEKISVHEFKEVHGNGMFAKIDGTEYFIGKPDDPTKYFYYTSEGFSITEVRKNGTVIGFFAIQDVLREDSKYAIDRLKELGITPVMVTGDNRETAARIAKFVGIEHVYSNTKPEDKLDIVRKFQSNGKKVIMVGDGINDAAALKGADIGVAIGSGSDLAIDSADVIIVQGGISKVVSTIEISRETLNTIKKNLLFAFLYNVIAIPLAMIGLLHPVIAEVSMAMSSMTVILISIHAGSRLQKIG